jgi:hypothetical protein
VAGGQFLVHDWSVIHPGNFTPADRPRERPVTTIVLHSTEETHADTLRIFADPGRAVSAHYLVRSRDGHLTRLLEERHIAWHSGNWHVNQHSIGIEHEGWAADGGSWFTPALYQATASLIQELSERYRIPLDRQHLLGHDNVPAATPDRMASMHTDPGPHWDWARLLTLLGCPIRPTAAPDSPLLTLLGNTVLRTAPDSDAPPAGPASGGQQFARADRRGAWVALWYEGRPAWLPSDLIVPSAGLLARPLRTADLYGSPLTPSEPLPFTVACGQAYACGGPVPVTAPASGPAPVRAPVRAPLRTPVPIPSPPPGGQGHRWVSVQFGHRLGYLKSSDVELLTVGGKNSAGLSRNVS